MSNTQWVAANLIIGGIGILAEMVAAVVVLQGLRKGRIAEPPTGDDPRIGEANEVGRTA